MRLIDADALIEFIEPGHLRHPGELTFRNWMLLIC